MSRQDAAELLGKAPSQIGHIETMRNLPSAADLEVLLTWYGHPERIEFFRELLKRAKKGCDWWSDFLDTAPEWFSLFLGLESSAVQIDSYDGELRRSSVCASSCGGWRKSSRSQGQNTCVEAATNVSGWVGVRDSKLGEASPVLAFTSAQWRAFVAGAVPHR
ncbi:transcriptional regulator with XRE-family HTH domain [Haloactinomyces albus]|uniref:Transcriptional regulator with XRE-family HTH domain n=1 Tax=Haloactinomyces albus TaxID=1352928 RepID=A0AAE3ZE41_9ACTN|nr:transcriptional regulator with XRE-family HTH domain [Haloactinomyces albus]